MHPGIAPRSGFAAENDKGNKGGDSDFGHDPEDERPETPPGGERAFETPTHTQAEHRQRSAATFHSKNKTTPSIQFETRL